MTSTSMPTPSAQRTKQHPIVEAAAAPLALRLIPSVRGQGQRIAQHPVQLATAMRALVVDRKHPIALEIAGTEQQRSLLIRARTQDDLRHVQTQLHARLPNATFVPLIGRDDPFHLYPGEALSVVELQPGRAPYLPLQAFEHLNNGEDPLLGLLAAVDALPADLRAVAQLVLVPASPTWSRSYQRKALEHALEPERQEERARTRDRESAPGTVSLVLGALVLAGILFFQHQSGRLPPWLSLMVEQIRHGEWQPLLSIITALLVVLLVILLVLRWLWMCLFRHPMYEMRSVAEKTSQPAYQVRLRLYVMGPGVRLPEALPFEPYPWSQLLSAGWMSLRISVGLIRAHQWKAAWGSWRRFAFAASTSLGRTLTCNGSILVDNGKCLWWYWRRVRQERARRGQVVARLLSAYRQYHLASGNYFAPHRVSARRARGWITRRSWWRGVSASRHLIDVEALAALWHLPTDETLPDLARIDYRRSRSLLLPPGLERTQREFSIGESEHAGHQVAFGLPADCLQNHFLIAGKSGEGKSTLMQHLAMRQMREEGGLIVIDPHGDLVDQILLLVPQERMDDVVLIDLSNDRFSCGLNPIDATVARGRDKAISDLIKVLSKMWTTWGSRMEIAFEYALRTLYEANKLLCAQGKHTQQYTLLDVMALLTDESFCHALLEDIKDPFILRWWAKYYDPLSLSMQRDRADPVLSKTAIFESTVARHILGQSLCTINFSECIEQEKIVLIKLAKGLVGEDVARILGAALLGFVQITFEEQGRLERSERKQLPILIDEFQTLDGVDWSALAELRKYGVTFCLATQSIEYLREKHILPIVLANVKQFAVFRLSAEDARLLARELDVDPEDIVHLERLMCYLRLVHAGRQHPTFSGTLHFPASGEGTLVNLIRTRAQRYMRPVETIEQELFERMARQIAAAPSGEKKAKDARTERGQDSQQGHARQDSGNRGRKAQEKRAAGKNADLAAETSGTITPMNWEETVGQSSPDLDAEQESDSDECEDD